MIVDRLLLTMLFVWQSIDAKTLYHEITSSPTFSQVAKIVNSSKLLPILLQTKGFTAFLPTDEAMSKYKGIKDEKLIQYHLANIPYKIQNVPDVISTELPGNPLLYITKIRSGQPSITGWEDYEYYVNNAKVISANHRMEDESGTQQFLHTIDQVIAPTIAKGSLPDANLYSFPDAKKVLEHSNVYGFQDKLDLRVLKERVEELKMMDTFEMEGKNTFFMPVTQALSLILRTDKVLIDKQVIHGHIVPGKVLFTRTVRDSKTQYESLAFTDNLKVFLSLENVTSTDTKEMTYYVTSNTVAGDPAHMKGAALARIIRGNIPVRNGVIHLIDRPLMVVASSIMSYLQEEEGQLMKFHHLMRDHYNDMTNLLVTEQHITLFAPSNKAFEMVNSKTLDKVIANREKLEKILRLHVVKRRLTTDEVVERSTKEIFQEDTMSGGRKLYFAVNDPNAVVPVVSLEGGGVNATITTPNIAAKNGVIHIIDRILGIPSQTVYEKLASDPMLRSTFLLSEQKEWNEILKNRDQKFTLFVPSDDAWSFIKREMPSAYKVLFSNDYSAHVKTILQRHMIANEDFNLEELEMLTTNSTPIRDNLRQTQLQMTRGKIYFQARVRESFGENVEVETLPQNTTEISDHEQHLHLKVTRQNIVVPEHDLEGSGETDPTGKTSHKQRADPEYFVEWNGIQAKVIRPDVECVNGVVHVIDKVLMLKRDITISGCKSYTTSGLSTIFAAIMSVTLAWALV